MSKSRDAFRTISEVSTVLDTPAHVLRFWESKFTQVKPVKRAGGRRYYRPGDLHLLAGIKRLLHDDGMTIKGAQKLLREQGVKHVVKLGEDALLTSSSAEIDVTPEKTETPKTETPEPAANDVATSVAASEETPPVDTAPVETAQPSAEDPKDAAEEDAPMTTSEDTLASQQDDLFADTSEVDITNVVSLQPKAPANTAGPALTLNLGAAKPELPEVTETSEETEVSEETESEPETAAAPAETVEAVEPVETVEADKPDDTADEKPNVEAVEKVDETPKLIMPDVPADPADSDSKEPARLFHLLHAASNQKLVARRDDIAPLLDRMQRLRDRISTR